MPSSVHHECRRSDWQYKSWLTRDLSIAAAAQFHYPFVPCLWLVRDRIVPIRFGRALYERAREPKEGWFAPEAGHGNLAAFGALDAAISFLRRHLG